MLHYSFLARGKVEKDSFIEVENGMQDIRQKKYVRKSSKGMYGLMQVPGR